ncbi:MAG: hypothetical protein BMS9Abin29_1137 [Gemmatimonadota bacterium]|nr:MAG: hypothetical protein BMS9Abin29_1137 [Gemmatimonadota bacterium]
MKTERRAAMNIPRPSRIHASVMVAFLAAVMVPVPGAAQGTPGEVVRARNEAAQRAVEAAGDSISDEEREALKDIINGVIDFRELSRRALGRHWTARTPEEQDQFVEVFRSLIRNSSVKKLEIYEADSITYQPAETNGDRSRVVTIAYKGRSEVEIAYLMHRVGGEWKVYDVVIDDSSTLRTYQDSFQREISSTSYKAMYDRMVAKLAESDGPGG